MIKIAKLLLIFGVLATGLPRPCCCTAAPPLAAAAKPAGGCPLCHRAESSRDESDAAPAPSGPCNCDQHSIEWITSQKDVTKTLPEPGKYLVAATTIRHAQAASSRPERNARTIPPPIPACGLPILLGHMLF